MLIAHLGDWLITSILRKRSIERLLESEYSLRGVFQLPVLFS
jgi:hypothetical protein